MEETAFGNAKVKDIVERLRKACAELRELAWLCKAGDEYRLIGVHLARSADHIKNATDELRDFIP